MVHQFILSANTFSEYTRSDMNKEAGKYLFKVSFPANKRNTHDMSIRINMYRLLRLWLKVISSLVWDVIYRVFIVKAIIRFKEKM